MHYEELEYETKVSETAKKNPPWMTCVMVATCLVFVTLAAVSFGVLIGYTYCYIEHRTVTHSGNVFKTSANITITDFGHAGSVDGKDRSINTALKSYILISKIMDIAQNFLVEGASIKQLDVTNITA